MPPQFPSLEEHGSEHTAEHTPHHLTYILQHSRGHEMALRYLLMAQLPLPSFPHCTPKWTQSPLWSPLVAKELYSSTLSKELYSSTVSVAVLVAVLVARPLRSVLFFLLPIVVGRGENRPSRSSRAVVAATGKCTPVQCTWVQCSAAGIC